MDSQVTINNPNQNSYLLSDQSQNANSNDDLHPNQLSDQQNSVPNNQEKRTQSSKSNFFLTVTIIMKTIIGAGILSLPYTISKLGYVLGILMFLIILTIIQFNTWMLLKAKNLSKHSNYSTIGYFIFKNKITQIFFSFIILLKNSGICIVQLIIIKQLVTKLIRTYIEDQQIINQFYTHEIFIVMVAATFLFTFTLVKKIQKLKLLSFFGVFGISIFIVAFICIFCQQMPHRNWKCNQTMKPFQNNIFDMTIVIPNMMLALAFQVNFFPIFKGMKNSNDSKMSAASFLGILSCAIFYIIVGNIGYCLFGNQLEVNFLLLFNRQNINQNLYLILYISFLVSVTCSFPVMFFGARNNFIAIIKNCILLYYNKKGYIKLQRKQYIEQNNIQNENEIKQNIQNNSKLSFNLWAIILFIIIVIISITVDDIQQVFNLIGAIASNAIAFIFPPMFYILLIYKKKKVKKIHFYIAVCLFVFFIPFGVLSVLIKLINDK